MPVSSRFQFVTSGVMALPFGLRDSILFGRHGLTIPAQKLVTFLAGYSGPVQFELRGRIGCQFESNAAERYFYARENYEEDAQQFIVSRIKPNSMVYDVGGHIGFMALLFSSLGARVVTFEPSPINYARLQKNLSLNPERHVIAIHAGASDAPGTTMFSEGGSMSSISTAGEHSIQLVRLDDVAAAQGFPDFMKIDVEGHGGAVLQGASEILKRGPDLIIELHNKDEEDSMFSLLSPRYRIEALGDEDRYPRRITAIAQR